MSQVSLGEIVRSKNSIAYRAINSKRVDMLIIDCYGNPICTIEYQGSGHEQGNWEIRDEIKRLALESANINHIEINPDDQFYIQNIELILSKNISKFRTKNLNRK